MENYKTLTVKIKDDHTIKTLEDRINRWKEHFSGGIQLSTNTHISRAPWSRSYTVAGNRHGYDKKRSTSSNMPPKDEKITRTRWSEYRTVEM